MKPSALDLFCKAGGAGMGLYLAGFDVVGIDHKPQPNNPFPFIQMDVMDVPIAYIRLFDFVHASPPCQQHTRAGHLRDAQGGTCSAVDLLPETRAKLREAGVPYSIENVPGAPMQGVTLCGSSFGLKVRRHRLFECSFMLLAPPCDHISQGRPVGVYHRMADEVPSGGKTAETLGQGQEAMGIDWMEWDELKEAIPPAYTKYIGQEWLRQQAQAVAA